MPCNNPAVPLTAANPINFCPSVKGEVLNTTAPFQATLNGSYEMPITDTIDGYFRFNLNIQGNNPNYGNFGTTASSSRRRPLRFSICLPVSMAATGPGTWVSLPRM